MLVCLSVSTIAYILGLVQSGLLTTATTVAVVTLTTTATATAT